MNTLKFHFCALASFSLFHRTVSTSSKRLKSEEWLISSHACCLYRSIWLKTFLQSKIIILSSSWHWDFVEESQSVKCRASDSASNILHASVSLQKAVFSTPYSNRTVGWPVIWPFHFVSSNILSQLFNINLENKTCFVYGEKWQSKSPASLPHIGKCS